METEQLLTEMRETLGREGVTRMELTSAILRLDRAIAISPWEPIVYVYRGIGRELLEPSVSSLPSAAVDDYRHALTLYQELREDPKHETRASVNICVVLDRLREGKGLKEALARVTEIGNDDSYELWLVLATLCQKVSRYSQANACLDKALKARPGDVHALLKKAYCLEGLVRLWDAEECFQRLLRQPGVGEGDGQDIESYSEACHGLGHIYTELGDREQGIRYMKAARDASPIYMCCYSAIHTELKDFDSTLKYCEEALKHPYFVGSEEARYEIIFERAIAYSGLQMFAEADHDFRLFEKWSAARGDTDAVAHAAIFQVKSLLKRSDLREIGSTDIVEYRNRLVRSPLSEYANVFIHEQYDQLLETVEAYIQIRANLEQQDGENTALGGALDKLRGVLRDDEQLPVFHISNDRTLAPQSTILDLRQEREAQVCDVWLATLREEISPETLVLLAQHAKERTIIVAGFDGLSLPDNLLEDVTLVSDDLDTAVMMAELTHLLDWSRRRVAEVEPVYAMAPIKTAPSFVSAQAGDVYPIALRYSLDGPV